MKYFLIFSAAFAASALLTPLARLLSQRWDVVAEPGGRRQHEGLIPKLGGLPLFGGLLVAVGLIYWWLPPTGLDQQLLRGVLLGTAVMFLGGLIDDIWELSPKAQFAIQFGGLLVAMGHEVFVERFTEPISGQEIVIQWTWLIFIVTLFWIIGMVNTVNFLDGLDGLATGVGTIAALIFAWHSYQLGQTTVAAFPLALAGVLFGFLIFNFAPATIFLGSAGAYVLGYQLATLSIISPAKIATALLVLAVPILDVAWRIFDRVRQGHSPFHGDRGHLHHLLLDRGVATRWIVVGYYVVAASFGLVAVGVGSPLVKLLVLGLLATAVFSVLLWLTIRERG